MTAAKHTHGPWRAFPWTDGHPTGRVLTARGILIATVADKRSDAEAVANQQLIAAAPDMLAALQRIADRECRSGSTRCGVRSVSRDLWCDSCIADAALARATEASQ